MKLRPKRNEVISLLIMGTYVSIYAYNEYTIYFFFSDMKQGRTRIYEYDAVRMKAQDVTEHTDLEILIE